MEYSGTVTMTAEAFAELVQKVKSIELDRDFWKKAYLEANEKIKKMEDDKF